MEKEFIPYTLALALKELGFDEECLKYWNDFGKTSTYMRFQLLNDIDDWCQDYIKAPLYQQAFRWFREKYGLVVTNPPTEMSNLIYFKATIYKYKPIRLGNTVDVLYNKTFKTYEEAELECLKKLIEIVKEK
jgi:hypothetical protein